MNTAKLILLVAAFVCFVVGALITGDPWGKLTAGGLSCWVATEIPNFLV